MCVFLLFLFLCGKRTNKKSVQKFNQGCLLFFEGRKKEDHFLNLSWIHKSLLRAYYKHTQRERGRERRNKEEETVWNQCSLVADAGGIIPTMATTTKKKNEI